MKKPLIIILTVLLLGTAVLAPSAPVAAGAMSMASDSCILLDLNTGQILYGKNPYTLYGDGSFNILLTMITALKIQEEQQVPDELQVSKTALQYYYDTPKLGLEAGQTVLLSDMLKAVYLGGYVDACNVIAENLGITLIDTTTTEYALLSDFNKTEAAINAFVHEMNVTADELGCPTMGATNPDQHFYDTQLCSCLDISYLIRAALKNDTFKTIFAAAEATIPGDATKVNNRQQDWKMKPKLANEKKASGKTEENAAEEEANSTTSATTSTAVASEPGKITLRARNPLHNGDILYSGIKGSAYAFNSNIEKYHALAYAEKDGRRVVAVAMAGPEFQVFDDLQALLNFGLYKWDTVTLEENALYSYLPDTVKDKNIAFYGRTEVLLPMGFDSNDLEVAVSYTEKDYLSGTLTVTLPQQDAYAGPITTVYFYETDSGLKLLPILKICGLILGIILALVLLFLLYRRLTAKSKGKATQDRMRKTAHKKRTGQTREKQQEPADSRHQLLTDPFPETTPAADYRQSREREKRQKPPKRRRGNDSRRNRE